MLNKPSSELHDRVIKVLYQEGTASRHMIAILAAASFTEVSAAVDSLIEYGLVRRSRRAGVPSGDEEMLELAVR